MTPAAGAKQRIIERNRYQPRPKAHRKTRIISDRGATQTYKKVGDKIITERGSVDVKTEGFQS